MSVHAYQTKYGTRYQVRWREGGKKVRTRSFSSKRDATSFDIDIRARRQRGEVITRPSKETLGAAYAEWRQYKDDDLAATTLRSYDAMWNAHVKDRFDHYTLVELYSDPQIFDRLKADMRARGVGNAAQYRTLAVISGVLTTNVQWRRIPSNPLRELKKPRVSRQRHPHPFPPIIVERIRLRMMRRRSMDPTGLRAMADACFVVLMSYAGLRPGEALALTWDDIQPNLIEVNKAVRDGAEFPTKTSHIREVPICTPLRNDLTRLRFLSGDGLVIPSVDGNHWSPSEFRNWRNRVWKPILKDLGAHEGLTALAQARPYDCRGTFVSLHLAAGENPLLVAEWAGHSPAVMFKHYANVIKENNAMAKVRGGPGRSVDEDISTARTFVEAVSREQLDTLTADLLEDPSIAAEQVAAQQLKDFVRGLEEAQASRYTND